MKSKKWIFCVIILVIIIAILSYYLYNRSSKKTKYANQGPVEKARVGVIDTTEDDVLNLSGFGVFFDKYSGEYKSSEIASHLEGVFTEFIPKMFDEIKNYGPEELKKYYNTNSYDIKKELGQLDYTEFSSFVKKIQEKNIDLKKWDRLDILKDSFLDQSDKKGYAYSEFNVVYKDESVIHFSIYVSQKKSSYNEFIIKVID